MEPVLLCHLISLIDKFNLFLAGKIVYINIISQNLLVKMLLLSLRNIDKMPENVLDSNMHGTCN